MAKIGFKLTPVTLTVKQGAPHTLRFVFTDADGVVYSVAGRTFSAQIRKTPNAADPVEAAFTWDITSAASGIVLGTISGAATENLAVGDTAKDPESRYVWDAKMTEDGDDVYIVPLSPFILEPRVTKT
jgi:hypothetical protein